MTQDSNQSSAGEKAGSPLIELIKLRKEYGAVVTALENVSFTVDRGEWIAVMGPSGSGKTTLLNMIGCLDSPTAGRVVIEGQTSAVLANGTWRTFGRKKWGSSSSSFI